MRYDSDILYRPPGEWKSYLLQCTIGCSYNKCTFCAMYKEKKFRIRPVEEILEDIDMARDYYGPGLKRVFLMDGDAVIMKTDDLIRVLRKLYDTFPALEKVTTYAGPRSTLAKSPEELRAIRGVKKVFIRSGIRYDYLMLDKEKLVTQSKMCVYALFDAERANHIVQAFRFTHKTFGGFISGKIIDSLIIGILCYIGTSLIGTPYQLLVSVVVGVTNVIPFFGPYLGAIPSAFLILMVNPLQCLYFLIFILILQQFDGNILGPLILGDKLGLPSLAILFSVCVGGGLFGIVGMFIGVPTFAVLYYAIKELIDYRLEKKQIKPHELELKE